MKNKDLKNLFLSEDEKIKFLPSQKVLDAKISPAENLSPEFDFKPSYATETAGVAASKKAAFGKRRFANKGILIPAFIFVLILTLSLSLVFGGIFNKTASALTAYVLEINPSISITTSDDEIVNICSLNEDADEILADESFDDIVGKTLEEAVGNIIAVVKEKGIFDSYDKEIKLFVVSDDAGAGKVKLDKFGEMVRKDLDENGLSSIGFNKNEMRIGEFKERMGFEGEYGKLLDMKNDIERHDKYKGNPPPKDGPKDVPPSGAGEPPTGEPPTEEPPTEKPPMDKPPTDEPPMDEPPMGEKKY